MLLKSTSSEEWKAVVIQDFNHFLADHADCERKAAATAMSLISRFPHCPEIVAPMIALAREELAHFHMMYKLLHKRGIVYIPNQKDPYIEALRKMMRHPEQEYFLDRLLITAVIEERAHERLASIAPLIVEEDLSRVYARLAEEEKAHSSIFIRLAYHFFNKEDVESRLEEWLIKEAEILSQLPLRAAIH